MRVLVTGASGYLGGYLLRELARRGDEVVAWSGTRCGQVSGIPLRPVNLSDADCTASAFRMARPSVVMHAAAVANVAECFRNPVRARQVNTQGTAVLAELTARSATKFVFVSTDLVFDGERGSYQELDAPCPLSVYGRTKADAEQAALANSNSAVVRVSLLFGPSLVGRPSFFDQQLAALRERRPMTLFADEWRTPLDAPTAARAIAELVSVDFVGTLHIGGPERMSRLELGRRLARCLNLDASLCVPAARADAAAEEPRPRDTSLDSSRWRTLFGSVVWPRLEEAIPNLPLG